MSARIFQPAKSAMQSGKAKSGKWLLEFESTEPRKIDPLMGYTVSGDMKSQISLEFESLDAARKYAERNGIAYTVSKPQKPKRRPMAYSDNFAYNRSLPWTH